MRPVRAELKCGDFDRFRATYCGLCRTMRRRCGLVAPMLLNFDFVFLALLLAPAAGEELTRCHRCHVPPFRRRTMCKQSPALEMAADESVILSYWKLRDSAVDDGPLGGLPSRLLALLLRRGYRRAAAARPEFDRQVQEHLSGLHHLEEERCPSLDRTADEFARLLQAAAPTTGDQVRDRAMEQLLYHLGRWIYLVDARDDLEEDQTSGSYNPILYRFPAGPDDERLQTTLTHSLNLMRAAFALLDLGRQGALVENVLYLGLPAVQQCVFDGSWKQLKKQKIWRNDE